MLETSNPKLKKLIKKSRSKFPLIGVRRRIKAIRSLSQIPDPEIIQPLLDRLSDENSRVTATADEVLRSCTDQLVIDVICKYYYDHRNEQLNTYIVESRYTARNPLNVRIFTLILHSAHKDINSEASDCVPILVDFLSDSDSRISSGARNALLSLTNQSLIDKLCELYCSSRDKTLEEIIIKSKFIANSPLLNRIMTLLLNGWASEINNEKSECIDNLITLISDRDKRISSSAKTALQALTNQTLIDTLCGIYQKTDDVVCEELICSCGYTAKNPFDARILTLLLHKKLDDIECNRTTIPPLLLEFMKQRHSIVQEGVIALIIHAQKKSRPDFVDAFYTLALESADTGVITTLANAECEAPDSRLTALALFIGGAYKKFDAYDPEMEFTLQGMSEFGDQVKELVHASVRKSGDTRYLKLVEQQHTGVDVIKKKDLTQSDIELCIDLCSRKKDYEKLIKLLKIVPYGYAMKAVSILESARYKPQSADDHTFLSELIRRVEAAKREAGTELRHMIESGLAQISPWRFFDSPANEQLSESDVDKLITSEDPFTKAKGIYLLHKKNPLRAQELMAQHAQSPHWMLQSLIMCTFLGGESIKNINWDSFKPTLTLNISAESYCSNLINSIPVHGYQFAVVSDKVKAHISSLQISQKIKSVALAMWNITRFLIDSNLAITMDDFDDQFKNILKTGEIIFDVAKEN